MLAPTHIARAPARRGTSTLSPARRWAEPAAGPLASAGAGHDLARISVSAPSSAPIQRVKWTWDASKGSWDEVGGSTGATAPTHAGNAHGDEYDDEYSQATDPTATPYHKSGAKYFGQRGAELQTGGREPSADEIREPAVGGLGRIGGAGLHEVVPTNLRGFVARSDNEALVGAQNGLRTATDYQLFSPEATDTGEVGGHTGFFRKPGGGSGSTHTRGQAPAHNTLRAAAYAVENEADPDVVVNKLTLAHLASVPTGQEVLQSDYITGAQPNLSAFGQVGPVSDPPDPERLKLAQDVHARREVVKARERGRARERDPGRTRLPSPSPERTPIDASGKGGEHVKGDRTTWATAPVPRFKKKGWKKVANETAWLTQPQRHGFDVTKAPLVRPVASAPTPPSTPVTVSPPVVTPPPTPTVTVPTPTVTAASGGGVKRKRSIAPLVVAPPPTTAPPPSTPKTRGRSVKRAKVTPPPVATTTATPAPTTKRGRPPKRKRQTPSPPPAVTSSRSRKARSPASPPPKRAKKQAPAPSVRPSLPRRAKKGPP
jgi:hypothetical protein